MTTCYVVVVSLDGNDWIVQHDGARVNDLARAVKYQNLAEAESIAECFRSVWKAQTKILSVELVKS